jgi:hypothetical protein
MANTRPLGGGTGDIEGTLIVRNKHSIRGISLNIIGNIIFISAGPPVWRLKVTVHSRIFIPAYYSHSFLPGML